MPREQASFRNSYQTGTAQIGSHLRLVNTRPCAAADHFDIVSAVENALAQAGGLDCSYIFVSAKGAM